MAVELLLCVATEFEGALLRERLDGSRLPWRSFEQASAR